MIDDTVARACGQGPGARFARWWIAWQVRRGNRAAIRGLWRGWRRRGDPVLWELLARTGQLSGTDPAAGEELVPAAFSYDATVRTAAMRIIIARGDPAEIDSLFRVSWDRPDAEAVVLLHDLTARGLLPGDPVLKARVLLVVGDRDGYLGLDPDGALLAQHRGADGKALRVAEHLKALELEEWFLRRLVERDDAYLCRFHSWTNSRGDSPDWPPDVVRTALRSRVPGIVELAERRCRGARGAELTALWEQALSDGRAWPALLGNPGDLDPEASACGWRLWLADPADDLLDHLQARGGPLTGHTAEEIIAGTAQELLVRALLSPRLPQPLRTRIGRSPGIRGHAFFNLLSGRYNRLDLQQLAACYRCEGLRDMMRRALRPLRGIDLAAIIGREREQDRIFVVQTLAAWRDGPRLHAYLLSLPVLDLLELAPHLARHDASELGAFGPVLGLGSAMTRYARVTRSPRIKPILRLPFAEMTGDELAVLRWIQRSARDNPNLCRLAQALEQCLIAVAPG
ncbi:hypothetical protein [Nonomuraea sp. SBT364]|uniref:hypothetical protein n=1 Tax=Nonomuraea sp. SBT364 TaxID=1580530 RepID=UPI00066C56EE|nr:hypothetical protein [Nonomuraea sp. SBT364]